MAQAAQDPILLSEDISAAPTPLQKPTHISPRVLVIGGGVIGLTTAWALLDRGVKVTILAKEWASWNDEQLLSSQAAGALWKSLPLECGPQAVLDNLATNQRWTLESYKVYNAMAKTPGLEKVVEVRPCTIVTTSAVDDNHIMREKVNWIERANIPGFRHGSELLNEYHVNPEHFGGLVDAYEYMAPVVNVNLAMSYLMDLVKSKGAILRTGAVDGDLLDQELQLLQRYEADVIVNATGLGAGQTAADDGVYGLHGALLRILNDGSHFPVIHNAMVVSSTKTGASGGEGAFILPRADNILVLGTISQSQGEATDLTLDSQAVREMRNRCEDLLPCLKNARLDPTHPILQGTRPQRRGGVRVGRETRREGSRIIHSYGHGGAGWSLAIGSAREVVGLVGETLLHTGWTPTSQLPAEVYLEKTLNVKVDGLEQTPSMLVAGTC